MIGGTARGSVVRFTDAGSEELCRVEGPKSRKVAALAIDGADVFAVANVESTPRNFSSGVLIRCSLADGTSEVLLDGPEALRGVTIGDGRLFVTSESKKEAAILSRARGARTAHPPLEGGEEPPPAVGGASVKA